MNSVAANRNFATFLTSPRNLRRAVTTSLIVGPILTLINQTHIVVSLFSGDGVPAVGILRAALTFLVPFVVSLVSAAMADASRQA